MKEELPQFTVYRCQSGIEIDRTPEEVFPYLVEPELLQHWLLNGRTGNSAVERLADGSPADQGGCLYTLVTYDGDGGSFTSKLVSEITLCSPTKYLVKSFSHHLPVRPEGKGYEAMRAYRQEVKYQLEHTLTGSQLSCSIEDRYPNYLIDEAGNRRKVPYIYSMPRSMAELTTKRKQRTLELLLSNLKRELEDANDSLARRLRTRWRDSHGRTTPIAL